jgi:hypothetical protein
MGIQNEIEISMKKEECTILFSPHKVFFHTGEVLLDSKNSMVGIRAVFNQKGALMECL